MNAVKMFTVSLLYIMNLVVKSYHFFLNKKSFQIH